MEGSKVSTYIKVGTIHGGSYLKKPYTYKLVGRYLPNLGIIRVWGAAPRYLLTAQLHTVYR